MKQSFFQKYSLDIFLIFIISISTAGVYYPVRYFDFISFDDYLYIIDNPHIKNGLNWNSIVWAFSTTRGGSWHPLTWISHILDISWYGMDAGKHHWTSVQCHIIASILLFIFFRITLKSTWVPIAISTCFALHPLHVESVVWASERKDALSVLFAHLTLLTYAWYTYHNTLYRKLMVLMCLCFSLISKPMMISMPILFCVIDYWPLNRWNSQVHWQLLKEKIIFMLPAIAIVVLTFYSQKTEGAMGALDQISLYYRVLNAGTAYYLYIWKMFFPSGLSIFYPHPGMSISLIHAFFSWSIIILMFSGAIYYRKAFPFLFTGTVWFLITLLPVIGIIQVGSQQMADRYTYFSMTGCAIILFMGLKFLFQHFFSSTKQICFILFGILIIGLSISTRNQVNVWQDNYTLFHHALNSTSQNIVAHIGIADYYEKNNQLLKALEHYQKAIHIRPDNPKNWLKIGKTYEKMHQYSAALNAYQNVLKLNPHHYDAHVKSGNLLAQNLHQYEKAMTHYQMALSLHPDDPILLTNIGNIEKQNNHLEKSLHWYIRAISVDDKYIYSFINLAILIDNAGSKEKSIINKCESLLKGMKKAPVYFKQLSRIFETNQKVSLANYFKQKASTDAKQ